MRRRQRSRFKQAARCFALATLLASCGSIGDPLPPLVDLPQPVDDLEARQIAHELEVAWSWPQTTTEGMIARQVSGFTLWAVDVPGLQDALAAQTIDEYRREVATVGAAKLANFGPGDRIDVRLPLSEWPLGQETILVMTATNRAGRSAGYSNQVQIQPLEPPERVVWQPHMVQAAGVALAWLPAERAEEYAIDRASGEDGAYAQLGRLAATAIPRPHRGLGPNLSVSTSPAAQVEGWMDRGQRFRRSQRHPSRYVPSDAANGPASRANCVGSGVVVAGPARSTMSPATASIGTAWLFPRSLPTPPTAMPRQAPERTSSRFPRSTPAVTRARRALRSQSPPPPRR